MSGLDGSDLKKMRAQTHDNYSYPNSTNQLGPLVTNNGFAHFSNRGPGDYILWQPLRSFALMSIFTVC
jgi:hypothetical protein